MANADRPRLPSLYSDFPRQKSTNPDGYAANITAWLTGLRAATAAGAIPGEPSTLSLQISAALRHELHSPIYGEPPAAALAAVVAEGVGKREMVPSEAFLERTASVYGGESRWRIPAPADVLGWALRQIGLGGSHPAEGRYVLVPNIEAAATKLEGYLSRSRGRVERVIPREVFQQEVALELATDTITDMDLTFLLTYLSRDRPRLAFNSRLVKLAPSAAERTIVATDADLASLKSLHLKLTSQVDVLTARIASLTASTKQHLAASNKTAALRSLRQKKAADAVLQRRGETLLQVEGVLDKIQEAADQVEVVQAMEGSSKVLQQLNRETGGVERVDAIADSLQAEMDTVAEVGQAMESAGPLVDEGEVDAELATMEQEAEEKKQMERQEQETAEAEKTKAALEDIPTVPPGVGQDKNGVDADDQKKSEEAMDDAAVALGRMSVEEPRAQQPQQQEAAPAT